MTYGAGSSFGRTNRLRLGPPFPGTAADNGLSVDGVTGRIVLGSDLGTPIPGQLLSDREIDQNGFSFQFTDLAATTFLLDPINEIYSIGRSAGAVNGQLIVDLINFQLRGEVGGSQLLNLDLANGLYRYGDIGAVGNNTVSQIDDFAQRFIINNGAAGTISLDLDAGIGLYRMGDTLSAINATILEADDTNQRVRMLAGIGIMADFDQIGQSYRIGDISALQNGTIGQIDDTNNLFRINNTLGNAIVEINTVAGFTGVVAPVNTITVDGGIVTNVA